MNINIVQVSGLEIVFGRLQKAGLKLKPKKCEFFRSEVTYLGHLVTSKGLMVDPSKIERVQSWPVPRTLKEVRSFLGLAGYYRKFVRDFSLIASPLHKLSQKDVRFKWTQACQEAFTALKSKLTSAPVLAYPDFSLEFIVNADASGEGSGAVLSQIVEGKEHPIAYASKKFTKAERRYSVTRQELLAVVTALKHFHHYLYGRKFLVRTDHGSLRWLLNFKDAEGQMARWLETLSLYNFVIEHRPGRQHKNADVMSRRPQDEECTSSSHIDSHAKFSSVFFSKEFSPEEIRKSQREDPRLVPLILALESGRKPLWKDISQSGITTKSLFMQWDQLQLCEGVLYRSFEKIGFGKVMQLVVPYKLQEAILKLAHNNRTAGHLGQARTLEKIRRNYFWVHYRKDVENWVRACRKCQRRQGTPKKRRAPMQPSAVGFPLERVAMDVMGPLPISARGSRFVLVIMDYFTKWAEAYPLPNQEAETIAEVFVTQFACRYGVPLTLHTDRGKNFDSKVLQSICKLLEIDKTLTSGYHPQSDGLVERANRTIENIISKYVQYDQKDWDVHVPYALMAYRASPQETTGLSPNFLMFGREVGIPLSILAGKVPGSTGEVSEAEYTLKVRERLEEAFEVACVSSSAAQQRQKRIYDLKVCGQPYQVGEKVWVYNPAKTKGITPKLQSKWQGPCTILKKLSDANYVVKRPRARNTEVVHFDRLKPCFERTPVSEEPTTERNCDTGEASTVLSVDDSVTSMEDDLPEAADDNQRGDGATEDLSDSSTGADTGRSTVADNQHTSQNNCVQDRTGKKPSLPNKVSKTKLMQNCKAAETLPLNNLQGRPQRQRKQPAHFKDFVMDDSPIVD